MVDHDLPSSLADFDRWVVECVLSTAGTISKQLRRPISNLDPVLKRLISAGFVVRHDDPIRAQRPTYALADPFLQFHYAILEPHGALLRERDPRGVWEQRLLLTFDARVRGPVFEGQARVWVRRFADPATLGGFLRSRHQVGWTAPSREGGAGDGFEWLPPGTGAGSFGCMSHSAAPPPHSPRLVAFRVLLVGACLGGLLLAPPASGLQAQESHQASGGSGLVVTQLPVSTRSLALAGALPLADRDPDLIFRNPALAERTRGLGMSAHRYEGEARLVSVAGGAPWLGGGVGLGIRSASYPVPMAEGMLPGGRPGERMRYAAQEGEDPLRLEEIAVTVGYGRLWKGVRFGAAFSGLEVRRDGQSDLTGFLDLGAAVDAGPVTAGVSGGGFGPSLDLPAGFRRVPKWVMAGAGTRAAPVGPLDISGAFAAILLEGGRVEAGGGVEVGWWPVQGRTLVGRAGLGGSRIHGASVFSLGGAFLGDSFTLEYAWRGVDGAPGIHGASLRFR
jgi:hypothetical protein